MIIFLSLYLTDILLAPYFTLCPKTKGDLRGVGVAVRGKKCSRLHLQNQNNYHSVILIL